MKNRTNKLYMLLVMFLLFSCSTNKKTDNNQETIDPSIEETTGGETSGEETTGGETSGEETGGETEEDSPAPLKDIDECNSTSQIDQFNELGYTPLIEDSNFKKGFKVSKNLSAQANPHHDEKLNLYEKYKDEAPSWIMAQWGTRFDIMEEDYKYQLDTKGLEHTITGYNDSKKVTVNSETGAIKLELNADKEYLHPRTKNESWPVVLLSQSFTNKTAPKLNTLSSLVVDVNFKVNKCDNMMGEDYNSTIHTAQFLLFLTVQNRTPKHPDYGKYVWFGFNMFDYRTQGNYFEESTQHDNGTSKLIFKTSSRYTMEETNGKQPVVGQQGKVHYDMIDKAKTAMNKAIELGYFTTSTWDDMYIGGFNFGFEVPGTFNIGVEIDSINFFKK